MALSKHQLLIPRVLCIGTKEGEPNDTSGKWISGRIIELTENWPNCQNPFYLVPGYDIKYFNQYPHLFKPLPWWYGRTVEEMPLFVKCIKTPDQVHFPYEVFKVNWKISHLGFSDRGAIVPNTDCYQPADESEYELYVSKIFTDKIVELSKEKNRLEMTIGKGVTLEKGGFASDRIDEIEKEITQLKDQYKK